MIETFSSEVLWIVILGFVIAFVLAFGIGANDVANSFGTSVGSGVLSLRTACILATICEISGAILLGYKVSDTMRKGIIDVTQFEDSEVELMLGCLAALASSAAWLLVATFFKLPISGTHSIVGATIGFSLVARGFEGVQWATLGTIVASWFVSPVLSGVISTLLFWIIRRYILQAANPLKWGLFAMPIFYGVTLFVNVFSVVLDGPKLLYMDNIPLWIALVSSVVVGLVTAVIVKFVVVPIYKKKFLGQANKDKLAVFTIDVSNESTTSPKRTRRSVSSVFDGQQQPEITGTNGVASLTTTSPKSTGYYDVNLAKAIDLGSDANKTSNGAKMNGTESSIIPVPEIDHAHKATRKSNEETPEVSTLFSFLQILTATFGSFAHGGNDVSNAIGPLIALFMVYQEGSVLQKSEAPIPILVYGGIGISIGLWLWGRRVIETIGNDLTKITPSTGFTIEVGAAMTVLLASKIGLPISTTHCKVGSVVFVGYFNSRKTKRSPELDVEDKSDILAKNEAVNEKTVDWHLFRNIIYAWVVTIPIAALLSAGIMFVLSEIVL